MLLYRSMLLLLLLMLWHATPARADSEDASLGVWVASANLIVRGTVTNVQIIPIHPAPPARADSLAWWKVTIEVHDTLSGPSLKSITALGGMNRTQVWVWSHVPGEQIFFLRSSSISYPDPDSRDRSGIRTFEWEVTHSPGEAIDLDALRLNGNRGFVTDDLRVLHTREDIIAEIRRLAVTPHLGICDVLFPHDLQNRLGIDSDGTASTWMFLALTGQTFAEARQWINSPDAQMRWCAAEILIHQRSPAHAAALLKLAAEKPLPVNEYGDPARARLLSVLRLWGAQTPALVQSSKPFFEFASPVFWLTLPGLLALPGIYCLWKRFRRSRPTVRALLWLGALGTVAVFGARSYSPRDALTYRNIDLAIESGTVYWVRHHRVETNLPCPLIVCRPEDLLRYQYAEEWKLETGTLHLSFYRNYENGQSELLPSFLAIYNSRTEGLPPVPSGLVNTIKAWFASPCLAIPVWIILALIFFPVVLIAITLRCWRWLRNRTQPRGFPVQINAQPRTRLRRREPSTTHNLFQAHILHHQVRPIINTNQIPKITLDPPHPCSLQLP